MTSANASKHNPARRFKLMFRLYAPTKALFEAQWRLPDVEKVN